MTITDHLIGTILRIKEKAINNFIMTAIYIVTIMGNQNLGLFYLLESVVQGIRMRDQGGKNRKGRRVNASSSMEPYTMSQTPLCREKDSSTYALA